MALGIVVRVERKLFRSEAIIWNHGFGGFCCEADLQNSRILTMERAEMKHSRELIFCLLIPKRTSKAPCRLAEPLAPGVTAESLAAAANFIFRLSQVGHAGLSHLFGRREAAQIAAATFGDAGDDAGRLSREMRPSCRLSDGRGELRSAALGIGEEHRARPSAQKARTGSAWLQAEGQRVSV